MLDVVDPEFAELASVEGAEIAKWVGGILVTAIGSLFLALKSLITRIMDKQDALVTTLMAEHNKTTNALADSVHRVETAIVKSDTANVAALGSLNANVTAAIGRLDKHEDRINTLDGTVTLHTHRLTALETWTTKATAP